LRTLIDTCIQTALLLRRFGFFNFCEPYLLLPSAASKSTWTPHQNLGFSFSSVFTENRGFCFGFKIDPALLSTQNIIVGDHLKDYITLTYPECLTSATVILWHSRGTLWWEMASQGQM